MTPALIRSQEWPQSAQPSPLQHVQLIVIMSTLAKLGFHDWSGDTNVYDWLLLNFNSNNCGPEVVTYGLVTDLKDLLHLKRSKHEEVPRNKLSRQQLCHLLIYLVTRISSENVTKNFENGLFKRLTAKDKENHDPNEVWESGIQYIKQQSLGVIGAPQGEGSVGGEDGDSGGGVADGDQVRGGADSHPRGEVSEDVRRGEELAAADKDGHSTVSGDTKIGGQGEDSADQGANKGENTHYLDTYIYLIFLHILN